MKLSPTIKILMKASREELIQALIQKEYHSNLSEAVKRGIEYRKRQGLPIGRPPKIKNIKEGLCER